LRPLPARSAPTPPVPVPTPEPIAYRLPSVPSVPQPTPDDRLATLKEGLIICLVLVLVLYWLGSRISLPVDIGPFLKSGKFWGIAQGVDLFLADLVFWSVVLLPLSFAFHFLVGLMIRGQFQDEAETMVHAWTSFKDHYRELILFPVGGGFVCD
jgi:hypothetical protein